MNEERETAYGPVFGFLAVVLLLFFILLVFRQPNPNVTIPLTNPSGLK